MCRRTQRPRVLERHGPGEINGQVPDEPQPAREAAVPGLRRPISGVPQNVALIALAKGPRVEPKH